MYSRTAIKRSELMITVMLALATLIPRLLLANQLDMVTDEIVYIHAGQIYQPLLQQLQFWSTSWQYNYEHPPVAKLLIGFSITINTALGHPLSDLFAGRLPSVLSSML